MNWKLNKFHLWLPTIPKSLRLECLQQWIRNLWNIQNWLNNWVDKLRKKISMWRTSLKSLTWEWNKVVKSLKISRLSKKESRDKWKYKTTTLTISEPIFKVWYQTWIWTFGQLGDKLSRIHKTPKKEMPRWMRNYAESNKIFSQFRIVSTYKEKCIGKRQSN